MVNRSNPNPFEQDGPTAYEQWNYIVGQAHGQLIINLSKQIEGLEAVLKEHDRMHQAASKAVLEMPPITQTEKPS